MRVFLLIALLEIAGIAAVGPIVGSGREPDPMAAAASDFLDSLDDAQRDACRFEFEDAERRHWQPVPFGEAGVRLESLSAAQRERLRELLSSVLSEDGLATVDGVMVLEGILVSLEAERGRPSRFHGPERYFVTVYGDPRGDAAWAWRIEGHHLSMTFTCASGEWTTHGPMFVGAQPARVRGGEHDGMRLLGRQDDNVRLILGMLDDEQRASAIGARRVPGNVILTPGEDAGFDRPMGLAGSDMSPEQRAAMLRAISQWAGWLREDLCEAEIERMRASLDETRLYWLGSTIVDAPHYWRIVGPHFAIEFAAPEADPDHVHALWRDLERDFGGDLLREHLERDHSGSR